MFARGLSARGRSVFAFGLLCGLVAAAAGRFALNVTSLADWIVAPLILVDTDGAADAIVVAGAGVIGSCEPNNNGVQRVLLAKRLWREGRGRVVLFTGGTGATCPVAIAMARLAREVDVPPSAIRLETGSRSTRENAELAAPLLRALGVRRVVVVTDRLHGRRASLAFSQMGFDVERSTVPIYLGHADNVSMLRAGLREYVALAYYRSKGWLGTLTTSAGNKQPPSVRPMDSMSMQSRSGSSTGPIVILGASYAAGWDPGSIGGAPVVNVGVGGQQSFEMLERFERDVASQAPRAVILWGFINDLFRTGSGDAVLDRVRDNYSRMVALARQNGIVPVLATEVTIRSARTWQNSLAELVAPILGKESYQDRINRDVLTLNQWIVEFASREQLLLLDLQSTLSEAGGRRRSEFTLDDGSHITSAGYDALTTYARPALEDHLVVKDIRF